MAISYLSSALKANPYILPVDLNLLSKVLTLRETNFKQNAQKIQQSIDQAQSTDLIKPEDKDYLQNKVSSLVNGINTMSGVDIGDPNIANQLNQMTSDIYSDQDLLESITSTQKVRKLTSAYEKMQSDPKLKGSFATQNMQWDMQGVNAWLNNGERTTADNGYKGTSTPTPYTDMDKLMVARAKEVKANYTKSSTKDGVYIHNVTGEEVTSDQIKNELNSYISENPQLQQQAQINSWFLHKDVTGQQLYTDALQRASSTRDFIKRDYEEAQRLYEVIPQDQKLQYAQNIEAKKQNLSTYDKRVKEIETEGAKGFEKNKEAYRTQLYVDNMTGHLSQSMSYNKFTDDVKPDLAQLALMKNQLEAAKIGADWVPDPTSPTGWSLVKSAYPIVSPKGTKTKGTGDGTTFDITQEGQLSPGLNTENKELWTDKKVAETIITKNDEKQTIFNNLINELITLNPNLASTYGKQTSQVALTDFFKGKNDPNRFEIEDLQGATSKWMTPAQTEYISNLYKSFQAVKEGKPPLITLTASQLDAMKKIQNLNQETDFYSTLLEEARGSSSLNSGERAAIVSESTGTNFKPQFISAKSARGINGGMEPIAGVNFETEAPTLRVIYNKNTEKFTPMDGKEHKYNNIIIPKEGVDAVQLEALTVPGGGRVEKSEIDPKSLYGVHVIKTQDQLNYVTATDKIKKSGKAPNTEAYKVLDEISGFYNYAIPSDIESQSKDGQLNLIKTGLFQELENGTTAFTMRTVDGELQKIEGQKSLVDFDRDKSYISRVGTSTTDPTQMEVEVTMFTKGTPKKPSVEAGKLIRPLRQDEAAQMGISIMPREYLIENTMVKYNGRTAPVVYIPQTQDQSPKLAVDMEVVYLKGTNTYVPQIKVPINGKMEYITLAGGSSKNFPNISGSSVNEVKNIFQNWINNAYIQGVKDNNTLYQYIKSVK